MRRILMVACLANLCFAAQPVIFDTDMGNDIDDALALAMLHALSDRGECQLIGVTLTNGHPAAVPYIRMVNRFYGRGDLPVGAAIKQLKDGGQSIVLVEQNSGLALDVADQVVIFNTGRCVFTGPVAEVRKNNDLIAQHLGVFHAH